MRKHLVAAAVLLTATATHAAAQDWSGAYAGLSFSQVETQAVGFPTGFPTNTYSGDATESVAGVFAGYNWQLSPQNVVGVEADILGGFDVSGTFSSSPDQILREEYANIGNLRARYGYSIGNALPYVALGITSAEYTYHTEGVLVPSSRARNLIGTNIALGLDYMVADRHQVRVELRHTQFEDQMYGPVFAGGGGSVAPVTSTDINFTELRIGYAFRF